jgi:type II secretory ATPase GspE/PulE/Tfp pilus assembly ATPase PilB-like protein
MVPLRQYGWNKVIAGFTTIEEVVRVTAADLEMADE